MALLFNRRLLRLVVIITHFLIVVLAGLFIFSIDSTTFERVNAIQPVQNNYNVLNLGFIGWGRDIGHGIAFLCSLLIGSRMITYGKSRTHEVTRFYSTALGVQILMSAALNLVLVGLVWFGGWWHLLSLLVSVIEAGSLIVTSAIMLIYWGSLANLAEKQDTMVSQAYGTTDEATHRKSQS
jgi:hypothetical protein